MLRFLSKGLRTCRYIKAIGHHRVEMDEGYGYQTPGPEWSRRSVTVPGSGPAVCLEGHDLNPVLPSLLFNDSRLLGSMQSESFIDRQCEAPRE